jgi:hypothetical protein
MNDVGRMLLRYEREAGAACGFVYITDCLPDSNMAGVRGGGNGVGPSLRRLCKRYSLYAK